MEKITDKINALPEGAHYFSLEFFPPKTSMVISFKRMHVVID
jgi:methylenetetrahydrofolate reductase (NADPH)